MRKLWMIGLLALMAFTAERVAVAVPYTPVAKVTLYRGKPSVWLSWSDSNSATVVRTDVRRRSTVADTLWRTMGATYAKHLQFNDESVVRGKTYRYQVRDSLSGAAIGAWSDSVSIVIP